MHSFKGFNWKLSRIIDVLINQVLKPALIKLILEDMHQANLQ